MKRWQDDQLQALLSTKNEHELLNVLISIAHKLGFDYCAYGLRMPLPVSQPKIIMFNNYPPTWQEWYQNQNYLAIDPTVHHGIRSQTPIIWSNKVFSSAPELWQDARSVGLHVGWAQSTHNTNGACGMLTLARTCEPLLESELQDKEPKLTWLTQIIGLSKSQYLTAKLLPESEAKLTAREVTVLRWTADGKTSSEISEIINISERTVNFHINNAVAKLNATNKLAAAVKATVLGMLY